MRSDDSFFFFINVFPAQIFPLSRVNYSLLFGFIETIRITGNPN